MDRVAMAGATKLFYGIWGQENIFSRFVAGSGHKLPKACNLLCSPEKAHTASAVPIPPTAMVTARPQSL